MMTNGLATLLKLDAQRRPPTPDPMSDADATAFGAERGMKFIGRPGPMARNNAKVSGLKRMLGMVDPKTGVEAPDDGMSQYDMELAAQDLMQQRMQMLQAEGEANAMPEHIRGQYGLAQEELRGQTTRDVADVNARAAFDERTAGREFTAGENRLNRESLTSRAQMAQSGQAARTQQQQAGSMNRSRMAGLFKQAADLRKQAGSVSTVGNFFTGNRDRLSKQAADIDAQIAAMGNPTEAAVAQLMNHPRSAGKSFDQLVQEGLIEGTPEELAELEAAFNAAMMEQ